MRKLEQQDRLIRIHEARAEGRRLWGEEFTEKESEVFDAQGQIYFSDLSEEERERFKSEQSQLWSLIPERFREKARRLAEGH